METRNRKKIAMIMLNRTNIDSIPRDVFYLMLFELPIYEIENLSKVDKRRKELIDDPDVWASLIKGDLFKIGDDKQASIIDKKIDEINSLAIDKSEKIRQLKIAYRDISMAPWTLKGEGIEEKTSGTIFPVLFCDLAPKESSWGILRNQEDTQEKFSSSGTNVELSKTNVAYDVYMTPPYIIPIRKYVTELEAAKWSYERCYGGFKDVNSKHSSSIGKGKRRDVTMQLVNEGGYYFGIKISYKGGPTFITGRMMITHFNEKATSKSYSNVRFIKLTLDCKKEGYFEDITNQKQRLFAFYHKGKKCSDMRIPTINDRNASYNEINGANVSVHKFGDKYVVFDENKQEPFCDELLSKEEISSRFAI